MPGIGGRDHTDDLTQAYWKVTPCVPKPDFLGQDEAHLSVPLQLKQKAGPTTVPIGPSCPDWHASCSPGTLVVHTGDCHVPGKISQGMKRLKTHENNSRGAGPMVQRLSSHILLRWPRVHWFGSQVWTWHCLANHTAAGVPHIK